MDEKLRKATAENSLLEQKWKKKKKRKKKIRPVAASQENFFFFQFFLCFKFSSPHKKEKKNVLKTAKNGPKSEILNQGKVEKSEMKSWGKIPRHGNINLIVDIKQRKRRKIFSSLSFLAHQIKKRKENSEFLWQKNKSFMNEKEEKNVKVWGGKKV